MAGHDGEMVTEGLDGLRDRLNEYHALVQNLQNGARLSTLQTAFQVRPASPPIRMRWRAMRRCVRRPKLFRLSSRKSLWMAHRLSGVTR